MLLASVLALVSARAQDPLEGLRQTVPGEPGTDYPILAAIPPHSFSCEVTLSKVHHCQRMTFPLQGKVFGGFYADPELDCQGYHVCVQGRYSVI